MLQHEPPLPPALHKARVSPLMQVAATGGPWSIRTAAYVGSHHQRQDVWTYRHEFRIASSVTEYFIIFWRYRVYAEVMDGETVRVSEVVKQNPAIVLNQLSRKFIPMCL